jgi:lipid-A-disaccharide synthase
MRMTRTHDLLLSILPFEKAWYASKAPGLNVEFIGHPIVDRYSHSVGGMGGEMSGSKPTVLLLPGSRRAEIVRHLPVLLEAVALIRREFQANFRLVVPDGYSEALSRSLMPGPAEVEIQIGGLSEALRCASVALASTGTVTLECAWFGVPTVALYKASPLTYAVGRRIVSVRYLAMPNLLACGIGSTDIPGSTPVMPEFIQGNATPEKLAGAVLKYLRDPSARSNARIGLSRITQMLGEPGCARRAARAILGLLEGWKVEN